MSSPLGFEPLAPLKLQSSSLLTSRDAPPHNAHFCSILQCWNPHLPASRNPPKPLRGCHEATNESLWCHGPLRSGRSDATVLRWQAPLLGPKDGSAVERRRIKERRVLVLQLLSFGFCQAGLCLFILNPLLLCVCVSFLMDFCLSLFPDLFFNRCPSTVSDRAANTFTRHVRDSCDGQRWREGLFEMEGSVSTKTRTHSKLVGQPGFQHWLVDVSPYSVCVHISQARDTELEAMHSSAVEQST